MSVIKSGSTEKSTMTSSYILADPAQCNIQSWIRGFYILCNFILSLLGKCGVAVCVLSKVGNIDDLRLLDHYQDVNVNVFLGCSLVLNVIGWLGIFAGLKNCHKSMFTNGLMLGIFLLGTISYSVTMGVITDYTESGPLYKQMRKEMSDYNKNLQIIDKLQTTFLCCGLDDITTWNTIPKSCCRKETKCDLGSAYLQTNGCFEQYIRTLRYYSWLVFTIVAFSGFLEVLGIMLSHLQLRIFKEAKKKQYAKETVLKIPRPQVSSTIQDEIQNNAEKMDKEKKDAENPAEKSKKTESSDKKDDVKEVEQNACRINCKDLMCGRVNTNS